MKTRPLCFCEVLEAWEEAYGALAEIWINREREIYQEQDSELFPVKASDNI